MYILYYFDIYKPIFFSKIVLAIFSPSYSSQHYNSVKVYYYQVEIKWIDNYTLKRKIIPWKFNSKTTRACLVPQFLITAWLILCLTHLMQNIRD